MLYAPKTFYFPSNTNALDYIEKIRIIAKKENINYLILKDEYDYDLREIIPYSVTSLEKLDYYCAFYYEKSKGISNVGGLVLEEFLFTKNLIQLYKSLIFEGIFPEYGLLNETKLKSFSTGDFFHLIAESIKEDVILNFTQYNSIFDPVINRYYRYLISSIDYIIKDNHPNVIDFNGIVSTLKYLQKQKKKYIDEFFNNFITKIMAEKNEDALVVQNTYISTMTHFYNAIKKLGPSFIAGDRLINMDTLLERNLHEIVNEILLNEAETPNKT
jgi:hypothetical protein